MIIKEVKPYIVSQNLGEQSFCFSQGWYNSRTILLVEIITDDGVSGFGEAFGNAFVNKAIIENLYAPRVIGQHVFDTEQLWDTLYNALRDNGQKGSCIQALSAIDNALWDLKGKYTHLPVYRLMGGARRDTLIPYATGFYRTAEPDQEKRLVAEAVSYVEKGFKAMKVKLGFGLQSDVSLIKAIRQAVGDDIVLMVDTNHAYNAMTAIQVARAIEPYNITWFEEPVPPEDHEGYLQVKQATTIPLAGGEAEFTRYGFKSFINKRCADILQPDCCIMGGISEFMKVMTMAKLENTQCFPHVWGSAVALQIGLNAAFAMPDFPESLHPAPVYFEYDQSANIFRDQLSHTKPLMKDGLLHRQEFEGLGVEINRELIAKYQVG